MFNLKRISPRPERIAIGLCLGAAILSVIGCDSGVELGKVNGRVTRDGQPQAELWVQFKPAAGGRTAEGRTDDEGRYELTYTGAKSGALVGRNRVTIYSGGETDSRDNELNPRQEVYSSEVDVGGGRNEFNFELSDN